jgi:hypothetical protein
MAYLLAARQRLHERRDKQRVDPTAFSAAVDT